MKHGARKLAPAVIRPYRVCGRYRLGKPREAVAWDLVRPTDGYKPRGGTGR